MPTNYAQINDYSDELGTTHGLHLDQDFTAVASSIATVTSSLALLQRGDGRLQDVSVEVHTLSPEVLNLIGGFNLRGVYTNGAVYAVNDLVSSGSYTYVCKTAHTGGVSIDLSKWIQFGFTSGADAAAAAVAAQAAQLLAEAAEDGATTQAGLAAASAASSAASAVTATSQAGLSSASASAASSHAASASASAVASAAYAATIDVSTYATKDGVNATGLWPISVSGTSGSQINTTNYLINGGCQVPQRGDTPAAAAGSWGYGGADRFAVNINGTTATGTLKQYASVATTTSFAQGVLATTTGAGSIAIQQRIEGVNAKPLNGKTVTASMWIYQNTGSAQNATIQIGKPTTTLDTFSAQTALSTSGNFSIPSGTATKISWSYTLGAAEATLGLYVSAIFAAVGAVTAKNFWIGDVQLEEGLVATAFKSRSYGLELMLCKRYCRWVPFSVQTVAATAGDQGAQSIPFDVEMRATPSFSSLGADPGATQAQVNVTTNTINASYSTTNNALAYIVATAAGSAYTYGYRSLATAEL